MKMNSLANITVSLAIALSLSACGGEKAGDNRTSGCRGQLPRAPLSEVVQIL